MSTKPLSGSQTVSTVATSKKVHDPMHPHSHHPNAYTGTGSSSNDVMISTETFHGFDLHYDELNQRLNAVKKEFGMRRAISTRSLAGETRTFAEILDQEVETIVFYYLEVQGILAKQIRQLRSKQTQALEDCAVTLENIEDFCQRYREIGQEVLALLTYLERNSIALKKILQRHDILFDQKMGSMYFDTRLANGTSTRSSQLKQLYHQEGVKAIIDAIRRGFEELYDARQALLSPNVSCEAFDIDEADTNDGSSTSSKRLRCKIVPRVPFRKRLASFSTLNLLDGKVEDLEVSKMNRSNVNSSSKNTNERRHFTGDFSVDKTSSTNETERLVERSDSAMGPRTRSTGSLFSYVGELEQRLSQKSQRPRTLSDLEPILRHIKEVSDRVTKTQSKTTLEFISNLGSMGLEFSIRDLNRVEKEVKGEKVISQEEVVTSKMGLYLNLYATFLYMANQYVVAPSSAKYANMLGMGPSMSGMIIGFAPAAALIGSLAYSMWTNQSFKSPLLAGICCGVMGNICYGAALQWNLPVMIFVGRLLTGFGGTRVISRRYIADHVSLKDRLVASSEFVTSGAMGLAFGPLIASLIERSDLSFTWMLGQKVVLLHYENVTAPGWIMAFMWFTALIAVLLFFEEPLVKRSDSLNTPPERNQSLMGMPPRGRSVVNYGAVPTHDIVNVELGDELWADDDFDRNQPGKKPQLELMKTNNKSSKQGQDPVLNSYLNSSSSRYMYNNHYSHPQGHAHPRGHMKEEKQPSCWQHITTEVHVILFLTMVNKAGQEMSVSSMPFIMKTVFAWDTESIGYYMAIIGAIVLPANILVNQFGKDLEERKMLLMLSYITMVGILIICQLHILGLPYTVDRYLLGTMIVFTALNALEGVIMSLLSKLISPELAKGTFNSGLLATEAGTFGRVLGDMAITMFGNVGEPTSLVNQLYYPIAAMIIASIALSKYYYKKLED